MKRERGRRNPASRKLRERRNWVSSPSKLLTGNDSSQGCLTSSSKSVYGVDYSKKESGELREQQRMKYALIAEHLGL